MANINDDTPTTGNPYLDSLIWGGKWVPDADDPGGVPHIAYYLASGQDPAFPSFVTSSWSPTQASAFASMLQLYANVANVQFDRVFDASQADVIERLTDSTHPYLGDNAGVHEIPDPTDNNGDPFYIEPLWGYYNTAVSTLANPTPGSFGFMLFVHEFGHALGLAHPHDGGEEDGQLFPGVTLNDSSDTGDFGLNQGIWTVMSYNDGWNGRPPVSSNYGFEETPMAFDIAALQVLYGANTSYHTGDDTYALPIKNGAGTGWSCIWDAGGIDTISAAGAGGTCWIDLNAATLLTNDPNAAGVVSSMNGVIGGFTIANGVVIENATGGNANDYLKGNAADNVLRGGGGADNLDGRGGVDTLIGGTGNDLYVVGNPLDKIEELAGGGTDTVQASCDYALSENVEILVMNPGALNGTGSASNNQIWGNAGANRLDGGTGADSLFGFSGSDTYVVDNVGDKVTEDGGTDFDTVESTISYTLAAQIEALVLKGDNPLNGTGNELDNTIAGNDKTNVLDGKAGADTMLGGKGNDTYLVDAAGDKADETGGDGVDTVKSSANGYTLNTAVENLTLVGKAISGFGNDLANIIIGTTAGNTLSGSDGNDSLVGDNGNDTLDGGKDNDTLDGGAGTDLFVVGLGDDTYRIDVVGDKIDPGADAGIDTVESKITFILGAAQENLTLVGTAAINGTGNDGGNVITGNTGANILSGGTKGETDSLIGGAGNDTYVVDSTTDKLTEADKGGTDLVKSSQTYTLSEFVENLTLLPGAGNIDGTGNGSNNVITGNEGNNRLDGKDGADTLIGGVGDDVYVVGIAGDKVTESLALGGRDRVESTITYTLGANLEDLTLTGAGAIDGTGNALANLLVGGAGANKLDGKAGADTMQGGLGDDIYVIDNLADRVDETGGDGSDTIQIATAFDLKALTIAVVGAIENVTLIGTAAIGAFGDDGANHLIGNSGANTLDGRGGGDVLDGLGGADMMIGGTGNDTYVIDNAKDVVQEVAADTADLIKASISIDLAAYAEIEDVTLTGTGALKATGDEQKNHLTGNTGANLLTGNDGADTLIGDAGNDTLLGGGDADSLAGGDGTDSLDGGAGLDSLAGGLGNDTYLIADAGNLVAEDALAGTDTVRSSLAIYTLDANVENLVLLVGALAGTGTGLGNLLTGNDVDNTLDGGGGADTLIGGKGNDSFLVDDIKDVVTEAAGVAAGTDTVTSTTATYTLGANVENLVLATGALGGTGNTLNNTLTGNGDDNTLDGKAGKDHMVGGVGSDTYVVDNVGDIVDELSGGSTDIDTVNSSITFSLVESGTVIGAFENLTLTGAGAISGTGNDFANHLIGNAGVNALLGGGGNDTINGGGGNDIVTGGAGDDHIDVGIGNDSVRYTSTVDGHDVIVNFDGNPSGGQDVLNLDALFDGLGVLAPDRAGRVTLSANNGSIDVNVDVSPLHDHTNVITVATLTSANVVDLFTVGQDVIVGS